MVRGGVLVACGLVAACGRMGFDESPPTESTKPDAAPVADADPSIDAAIGMGSYTLTELAEPYVILESGTTVPGFEPGSDEGVHVLPLPFTFPFYGVPYDSISVHINGYASFGAAAANPETYENDCPLDASAPDAMIAVFWDDLFASKMIEPFGTVRYAATPDLVEIEWRDVDAYYHAGTGNNFFSQGIRTTQKLVLYRSGKIDLHYGPRTGSSTTKDCGVERHVGCSATVGLRAPSSSVLHTVQCATETMRSPTYAPLVEGRLFRFTPS